MLNRSRQSRASNRVDLVEVSVERNIRNDGGIGFPILVLFRRPKSLASRNTSAGIATPMINYTFINLSTDAKLCPHLERENYSQ